MRGKQFAIVGALALAAGVSGPAHAAAASLQAGDRMDLTCPAGQKIVNVSPPHGTLSGDGASFAPVDPAASYRCADARTETRTGTTTTVQEIITGTTDGEQSVICCPAGTRANSTTGQVTSKFQHWKGDTISLTITPTPDHDGYLATRNGGNGLRNFGVSVTCEQAG